MTRRCIQCGQEFESARRLTCSNECRLNRRREIAHAHYEANRDATRDSRRAWYEKNRERIRAQEEAGRKLRKKWHNW